MVCYFERDDYPDACLETDIDGVTTYPFEDDCKTHYGEWLVNRVEQYLLVDPAQRPTFEELKTDLERLFENDPRLRKLENGTKVEDEKMLLMGLGKGGNKVGMAFQPRIYEPGEEYLAVVGPYIQAEEDRWRLERDQEERRERRERE